MTLGCRKTFIWLALIALTLMGLAVLPHPHAHAADNLDDCALCHVHHAPLVTSQVVLQLPRFVAGDAAASSCDDEEHDAVLGQHPSRAPPA